MRLAPTRALHVAVVFALTSSLAACATLPAASPFGSAPTIAPAPVAVSPKGKVTINFAGAFGSQRGNTGRQALAYGLNATKYQITQLRVMVKAPGDLAATQVGDLIPWNTSAAATADKPALPATSITAEVPVGKNKVFTVEALDASNNVLMRMNAAASVSVVGTASIRLNLLEDAVARAISDLVALETEASGMDSYVPLAMLSTDDLVEPLRNYLTSLTGFNRDTNSYTWSRPAPQLLKTYILADRLFNDRNLDWLAANANFDLPPGNMDPALTSLMQEFRLSGAMEVKQIEFFGLVPEATDHENYTISVLAPVSALPPSSSGWGLIDHQPFDGEGNFTSDQIPLGIHTIVVHGDNTQGGENDFYGTIYVSNFGVRTLLELL